MMMTEKPKPKYLYFDPRDISRHDLSDGKRFTLRVRFVVMDEGQIKNPGNDHELGDLVIDVSCEINREDDTFKAYYRDVYYYDVYLIRRFDARRMARTLDRIARFLENSPIRPETFGQYCALIAQAIKARGVIVRLDDTNASNYADRKHERFAKKRIQSVIDDQLEMLIKTRQRLLREARA